MFKFHNKNFFLLDDQFKLKKFFLDTNEHEDQKKKDRDTSLYKFVLLNTYKFTSSDIDGYL